MKSTSFNVLSALCFLIACSTSVTALPRLDIKLYGGMVDIILDKNFCPNLVKKITETNAPLEDYAKTLTKTRFERLEKCYASLTSFALENNTKKEVKDEFENLKGMFKKVVKSYRKHAGNDPTFAK